LELTTIIFYIQFLISPFSFSNLCPLPPIFVDGDALAYANLNIDLKKFHHNLFIKEIKLVLQKQHCGWVLGAN